MDLNRAVTRLVSSIPRPRRDVVLPRLCILPLFSFLFSLHFSLSFPNGRRHASLFQLEDRLLPTGSTVADDVESTFYTGFYNAAVLNVRAFSASARIVESGRLSVSFFFGLFFHPCFSAPSGSNGRIRSFASTTNHRSSRAFKFPRYLSRRESARNFQRRYENFAAFEQRLIRMRLEIRFRPNGTAFLVPPDITDSQNVTAQRISPIIFQMRPKSPSAIANYAPRSTCVASKTRSSSARRLGFHALGDGAVLRDVDTVYSSRKRRNGRP